MIPTLRALAFAAACGALCASAQSPNSILRNGAIRTLDARDTRASALVIENGRIAYVGDDAGARAFERPGSRIVDLRGRAVLPGFHDGHAHPMSGGMRLLRCRFGELKTEFELEGAVRLCAAKVARGEWVVGTGWSPKMFVEGSPTRARLDALVPDRPAYLTTEDGFTAWINSQAYALAGVGDPPAGPATGDVAERVRRKIPAPTQAEYREALRRSTRIANAFGVTSMFDAAASEALLDAYAAADRAGELTVRITAAQRVDPARGVAQVEAMVERRERLKGRRLQASAAKIFLDGEIDDHTAALLEPYADNPGTRGELYVQPAALNALVQALDAKGFDLLMHVMGDRAVRAGLDALEAAARANGARDRRPQLAHLAVVDPADIPRFAKLGVAANVQPAWARADDPPMAGIQAALGKERSRHIYPIGSIAAAGGRITAGSDWPAIYFNPLEAMQVAVTRQPLDASAAPVQPDERVKLGAILAAYTKDPAWAAREEALDGTIEVGKAADLVVLERDLFDVQPGAISRVRVVLTLLDGEPVYRDPALAWP